MRLIALTIFCFALPVFAQTGVQKVDGNNYTVIPLAPVPDGKPFRLVVMGDGFKAGEQAAFNTAVDNLVADLRARAPYSLNTCALDIYRINVASKDSGIDHPASTPAVTRDTYLNTRFGRTGEVVRCITSDTPEKIRKTAALAPAADFILVLANDAEYGGCFSNGIAFASMASTNEVVAHELGHQIGRLADEYTCLLCDGTDNNRAYSGTEPDDRNTTIDLLRTNPKWGGTIAPTTAIPTITPPAAATEPGFRLGAATFATGIYRSEENCMMRDLSQPFCAQCSRELGAKLHFHCGDCVTNPGGLPCILSIIQANFQIHYPLPRWQFRWPVPPCYHCPFIALSDRFEYILKGAGRSASLRVIDSSGRVLAAGRAGRDGAIAVSWSGARSAEYWIAVDTGGTLGPTTLRSELKRNGLKQSLP